jgi:condensin complex subunit 1
MGSFDLQDEIQALRDVQNYEIPNEHDIQTEDPARLLEGKVLCCTCGWRRAETSSAAAVEAVAESSDAITDPEVFDIYRSLLKRADAVPGPIMSKLLDSISSGLLAQVEATIRDIEQEDQRTFMAHKTPLEMYALLLQWFVTAVKKVKETDEGDAAPVAPPKSRRGRGGKAGGSRTASGRAAAKNNETCTWTDQIPPTLALISRVLRLKTQRIWTTTAERDTFISCV